MATLIARGRDTDFSRRKFVGQPKESAVRTGVGAKAFLSQKINGHETADEKKRDCNCNRRESLPKIGGYQMVGELGNERRALGVMKHSIRGRPHKHVQCANERDIYEQTRSKWLRMKPYFLQQPATQILQSENVTAPPTYKPSQDQRRQNCQREENKPRVNESLLQGVHRFRRLNGRNRLAHDAPLNDVR